MKYVRKIMLVNKTGKYDLSTGSSTNTFLASPNGLGYSMEFEWERSADGFFVGTSAYGAQGAVAGSLVFLADGYRQYRRFLDFVHADSELEIGYLPGGDKEIDESTGQLEFDDDEYYYASCKLSKIEKSEMSPEYENVLIVSVEFVLLSLWAKKAESWVTVKPPEEYRDLRYAESSLSYTDEASVTKYPGVISDTVNNFRYGDDHTASGFFEIAGDTEGAYEIEFGPLTVQAVNPKFSILSNADNELASGIYINETIPVGHTIKISTRPENSYIRDYNADGEWTDLSDSIQLLTISGESLKPFYRPKAGQYSISMSTDMVGTASPEFLIKSYSYYRSV